MISLYKNCILLQLHCNTHFSSTLSRFSTLVAIASAADVAETLGADGSFTFFAPTNAAFDKVGTEGQHPA